MRTSFSARLPQHTIEQIRALADSMDESQAHVIILAVDRMSREANMTQLVAEQDMWIVRETGGAVLIQYIRKGWEYPLHCDAGTLVAELDTEAKADQVANHIHAINELENSW